MPPAESSENHVLSLLQRPFKDNTNYVFFRPNLGSFKWGEITVSELEQHCLASREHWVRDLSAVVDLKKGDTVGLWLTGKKYDDAVNIIGVSLAGYIPQMFSIVFPNPLVVWDLLSKSGAKAIICDPLFADSAQSAPVPTRPSIAVADLNTSSLSVTRFRLEDLPPVAEKDTFIIFHSSGTTSGTPKLIPTSHLHLKMMIQYKYPSTAISGMRDDGSEVTNTLGSLAHVGSFSTFLAALYNGISTVQSTSMDMPTSEVAHMIKNFGLNRIVLYATFLSTHIRAARQDPEILKLLQSTRSMLYTGVALNEDDEAWARAQKIPILPMYGTTETGPLMSGVLGDDPSAHLLRPILGATCEFLSYTASDSDFIVAPSEATSASSENPPRPTLFELVMPLSAPESPHPSLINPKTNVYHTSDLFEEVQPGRYVYRGRTGDWLKTIGGFCDTKNIEDAVRRLCVEDVEDAVVLGNNRPGPCLVVELKPSAFGDGGQEAKNAVAKRIVENMTEFNERLFKYERIDDPRKVLVLEKGSLPRNKEKGNVRRNAAEEMYANDLDRMFNQISS